MRQILKKIPWIPKTAKNWVNFQISCKFSQILSWLAGLTFSILVNFESLGLTFSILVNFESLGLTFSILVKIWHPSPNFSKKCTEKPIFQIWKFPEISMAPFARLTRRVPLRRGVLMTYFEDGSLSSKFHKVPKFLAYSFRPIIFSSFVLYFSSCFVWVVQQCRLAVLS